jgi:4-amino-4-deoxy-L-arabinose transferase-like glycosyltransferase
MPKVPFWVFIVIAVLYFTAVRVDTMDIDASQYAEISREMMNSGDYLHVYDRGFDYLDKPPFLFWTSALSMKVFGVNNLGYKLPSILFALLAIYATYRLAKLLYGEITGRAAALVLACCQGMFLMTNDVRCDTILMSCVVTAIWLIQEWYARRKTGYLLGGFVFIGLGMMTKGPIALLVPVFSFASDWALKRQWKNFFRPAYLLGVVIIALILLPMSVGLYQQFDVHPEKVVNGKQGLSGLRFFYWSQSFGRITGESPWKNDVDLSFLLQNMLWSFLPWIFVFLPALVLNIVQLVRQKFRLLPQQEWLSTGGFILSYLALGSSAYQLPHYIFVAFPLAAIVSARLLYELTEEKKYERLNKFLEPFQSVITLLLLLAAVALVGYAFPSGIFALVLWVLLTVFWMYLAFSKILTGKILLLPAAGMIIVNIFITNNLYYTLLNNFQAGSQAGRYIHRQNISAADVVSYKMDDPLIALNFYAQGVINGFSRRSELIRQFDAGKTQGLDSFIQYKYILTNDSGLNDLHRADVAIDTLQKGVYFKVSELSLEFINPATRSRETKNFYFLKVRSPFVRPHFF